MVEDGEFLGNGGLDRQLRRVEHLDGVVPGAIVVRELVVLRAVRITRKVRRRPTSVRRPKFCSVRKLVEVWGVRSSVLAHCGSKGPHARASKHVDGECGAELAHRAVP